MSKKNSFDAAYVQVFANQPAELTPQSIKPNKFSITLTYGRCRCVLNLPNFNVRRTLGLLYDFALSCGIPNKYRKDPNGFIPDIYNDYLVRIIRPLSDFYAKYCVIYGEPEKE